MKIGWYNKGELPGKQPQPVEENWIVLNILHEGEDRLELLLPAFSPIRQVPVEQRQELQRPEMRVLTTVWSGRAPTEL